MFKENKDTALQSHEVLQTFVWWGANVLVKNSVTLLSYIFVGFQQITFKLDNFNARNSFQRCWQTFTNCSPSKEEKPWKGLSTGTWQLISLGKKVLATLYYYIRNFCILIGLEQWYFTLIWNTYMWKLQTFCG